MSKPIQDRIYRSRLTIKYRTNIDGVPVAQTLPLRLLVLGNLRGNKAKDGAALPKAAQFENRHVVSIKRGTRIDKVIEEMDITFPIPTDETGRRKALLDTTATVMGRFTSERKSDENADDFALWGNILETDDQGRCAIDGVVNYKATVYDNRQMRLGGRLEASGAVHFGPVALLAEDAELKGLYQVAITEGTTKLTASNLKIDAGTGTVALEGKGSVRHAASPADKPWFEGPLTTRGDLKGKFAAAEGRQTGTLELDQDQLVMIEFAQGVRYNVTIRGTVAVKNDAPLKVGTTRIKVTATDGATKTVQITEPFDVDAPTATKSAADNKIELEINSNVRIPKSNGDVLTGTVTGKLSGAADSYKAGAQEVTGDLTVSLSGEQPFPIAAKGKVNVVVSGETWSLDPAAPACTLHGEIPIHVIGKKAITELLEIPGKTIKTTKQGICCAQFRKDTPLTLDSDPSRSQPTYHVAGTVSGMLSCNLKDLTLLGPAKTMAGLKGSFKSGNGMSALELGGSMEAEVPKPTVTVTLSGRLRGEVLKGLAGPDALQPEDVRADVHATVTEGAESPLVKSDVVIDENGNLSVNVSGPCEARRSLRLSSLESFTPDSVARNVPEIRRLRIIAQLLEGLKSLINMKPEVRKSIKTLFDRQNEKAPCMVIQAQLFERYPALLIGDVALDPVTKLSVTEVDNGKVWFEQAYTDYETVVARTANIKGAPDAMSLPSGDENEQLPNALVMVSKSAGGLRFHEHDIEKCVSDRGRLANALAALLMNAPELWKNASPDVLGSIDGALARIDERVQDYLGVIIANEDFRLLERNWRQIAELHDEVKTDDVIIDLLDVGARELAADLDAHAGDIFTSTLFKRVYIDEYDRYGGKPFGAMIGLYRFNSTDRDIKTLTTLSEIANAAHCPFISGVAPTFFGEDVKKWTDLDKVADIEAHMNLPKFGKWNVLRDSGEAPYLGLVLPGYLLRKPWSADDNRLGNRACRYDELTGRDPDDAYLWGNSAVLFARNLVRSFENSGWCQYIRGVKGGGLIQGLRTHSIKRHGKEELQSPVQYEIADYRELQFAKAGLIPLVHCKESADATFFSTQSLKKPRDFRNEIDTQNAYLVTNLAYTFSITRIAHYVKRMMRDYIGSTADGAYIQNILQVWLGDYITTTVNPDDLTLRYYPFKAVSVDVQPKPGPLGWYKAVISILPHIQFEGMDVELRLEAALGGK